MRILINILGSLILTLVFIGIPIITAVSYCLGWPEGINLISTLASILEIVGLWSYIMDITRVR